MHAGKRLRNGVCWSRKKRVLARARRLLFNACARCARVSSAPRRVVCVAAASVRGCPCSAVPELSPGLFARSSSWATGRPCRRRGIPLGAHPHTPAPAPVSAPSAPGRTRASRRRRWSGTRRRYSSGGRYAARAVLIRAARPPPSAHRCRRRRLAFNFLLLFIRRRRLFTLPLAHTRAADTTQLPYIGFSIHALKTFTRTETRSVLNIIL